MLFLGIMAITLGLVLTILCVYFFFHAVSMLRGAPYVVSQIENIRFATTALIDRKCIADIGSGDGTVLLALARTTQAELHGYEINPFLVWIARWRVWRSGFAPRVHFHWSNLWQVNFSPFDGIYLYGLPPIMPALGTKLRRELAPGTLVVSAAFPFPGWQPILIGGKIFLYQI